MARGKPSTDSTPRDKTIAEMRAEFNVEETRRKENWQKALDAIKKIRDPNKPALSTLNSYDREKIREYLKRPYSNEANLRQAAEYLYFRNQILYRLCHWYASMWALNCRQVIPEYSLVKENDPISMRSQYEETLNMLDAYDIQGNWHDVALRCYLEDACFTIFYRDDKDAFFYILNPL